MPAVPTLVGLVLALLAAAPGPRAPDAVAQGLALLSERRVDEVERVLRSAVAARPADGPAWNALGLAHHARTRWESASEAFGRAASLMPTEPRVRANVGAALFEKGDLDAVRRELRQATRLGADHAMPRPFLGRVALASDDVASALRHAPEARDLAPRSPAPHALPAEAERRRAQQLPSAGRAPR